MVGCIIVGSIAVLLGMAWGRWTAIRSLLVGVDDPGRTPHKLGDGFYYVVPEREYIRCRCRIPEEYRVP